MPKLKYILGLNARNQRFLKLNPQKGRRIADSKLLTKKVLKKRKISHPELYAKLDSQKAIDEFDWLSLKRGFVLKPSEGWGGEGILVIKKPAKYAGEWQLMDGKKVGISDLKLHAQDIIGGRYSRNKAPDTAFVEERVKIHPVFSKIARGGTPDVRVIVYSQVPVMAMLRLPTEESRGKANLHQGAIGLGLDVATGITTYGIHGLAKSITHFPHTDKKVNGIRVPFWEEVLEIAIRSQKACDLGYLGVDIVLDKEKGPMVLELNDQPGLGIQIANMKGLLGRLDRIEGLEVESAEKGIKVADVLFAERFADKVKAKRGRKILGIFEKAKVKDDKGEKVEVIAKVDTGAFRTSIDRELAKKLGLLKKRHVLWRKTYKSALGRERRPVIEVEFWLQGRKVKSAVNVAKRSGLTSKLLVGRRDLTKFVVDPSKGRNY